MDQFFFGRMFFLPIYIEDMSPFRRVLLESHFEGKHTNTKLRSNGTMQPMGSHDLTPIQIITFRSNLYLTAMRSAMACRREPPCRRLSWQTPRRPIHHQLFDSKTMVHMLLYGCIKTLKFSEPLLRVRSFLLLNALHFFSIFFLKNTNPCHWFLT